MKFKKLGKTTEEVEDIIGSLVVGSGDVNVTYDDTTDQLSIDVSTLTNGEVQDTVASFVASDSNLSWSYDDTNNTLTVSLSDSISVNTLEADKEIIVPKYQTKDELPTNPIGPGTAYVQEDDEFYRTSGDAL